MQNGLFVFVSPGWGLRIYFYGICIEEKMTDDMTTPATTHSVETRKKDWKRLCDTHGKTMVSSHNREGMLIIEHYQPHFWNVESPTGESIAKNWLNPDLRQKAEDRTKLHYTKVYKSEIRRNLAFFSKAPLPTVYRPLLVKGIVEHTGAKQILDPTIGWGGRLIGTLAVDGTTFTGCDPCLATFKGLENITDFIGGGNRATLYQQDCLTVLPTLTTGFYDLVLTSPPYFDLEVYSKESSQSVQQFTTWNEWVKGFLKPMIIECLRCLKPTGVSAWSVKNIKKCKLQDEVFRIHKDAGWTLSETMGMTATPRNTGGKAKITEETFLFRKVA
jgi:hypothetical protein